MGVFLSVFSIFQQLDLLHYLAILVCALGVCLAYLSESDVPAAVVKTEDGGVEAVTADKVATKAAGRKGAVGVGVSVLKAIFGTKWVSAIFSLFQLTRLSVLFAPLARAFHLLKLHYGVKRLSQSKRHYFYLMEKKLLGVPIRDGESEVDSYLDCKAHMGKKWPFMWQVDKVKENAIKCQGYDCIPLSSYSYLDLIRNTEVQEAAIAAARDYATGNHGPRMLGGNMKILCDLEEKVASFFQREACLLCATGYLACMSAMAAVSSSSTVMFGDSRLHASIRAGLKIGEGKTILFPHNDFAAARKIIAKNRRKYLDAWMVIESVYSMDGDCGDLPAAVALCKEFNLRLVIDEAHGLGVLGKTGRGLEEHHGMQGIATLIMGTFSKSVAGIGGYICGPKKLIEYMDFHAPGNVFSAPLPAYCAGGALKAFELIDKESWRVTKAQENARYLRESLASGLGLWPANYPDADKYELEGDVATTVIPVVFQDDITRVMTIASEMKQRGFMLSAVAYPACPLRRPRFRVTATTALSKEIIERFVRTFVEVTLATPVTRLVA